MRLIDISGPLENGMWGYGDPYPPVEVTEVSPAPSVEYTTYSQAISMSLPAVVNLS